MLQHPVSPTWTAPGERSVAWARSAICLSRPPQNNSGGTIPGQGGAASP